MRAERAPASLGLHIHPIQNSGEAVFSQVYKVRSQSKGSGCLKDVLGRKFGPGLGVRRVQLQAGVGGLDGAAVKLLAWAVALERMFTGCTGLKLNSQASSEGFERSWTGVNCRGFHVRFARFWRAAYIYQNLAPASSSMTRNRKRGHHALVSSSFLRLSCLR